MTRPSVLVGIPAYGSVEPESVMSLLELYRTAQHLIKDVEWRTFMYIDQSRNELARKSIDRCATHLLFLDTDMTWPAEALQRLLRADKPVVGGTYFYKKPPHMPLAGNFTGDDYKLKLLDDIPPGLFKVDCTGTGCCLIQVEVLDAMHRYYYDDLWFNSCDQHGEDVWFFRRCKDMSIAVWQDGALICDHIGRQRVNDFHWRAHRGQSA